MIKYNNIFDSAILSLHKVLIDFNYDLLVHELKLPIWYFRDPGFIHYGHSIDNRLSKLPKSYQLLIRLFSLTQPVSRKEVEKFLFSKDLIDELIALGLFISEEDTLQTDWYTIIPLLGVYAIATIGTARSMGAFVGRQSYFVATKMLEHSFDSALDIGSGCGILAILAAQRAKEVVGIDILPEAVEVGKANAVLNKVDKRVEFFCGDMYQPVKGLSFDAVFSNVPFLALPEKYQLVAVSSGEDGLRFIEPLIDGMFRHKIKTSAIVANGLGDETQPLLVSLLKNKLLARRGYQAKLLVYAKGLIDDNFIGGAVKMVASAFQDRGENITKEEIYQDLKEIYQKLRVDYYYGIILEIETKTSGPEIEIIDISNKYNLNMSPSLRQKAVITNEKASLLKRGETVLSLGEVEKNIFMSMVDKKLPTIDQTPNWMGFASQIELMLGVKKQ